MDRLKEVVVSMKSTMFKLCIKQCALQWFQRSGGHRQGPGEDDGVLSRLILSLTRPLRKMEPFPNLMISFATSIEKSKLNRELLFSEGHKVENNNNL